MYIIKMHLIDENYHKTYFIQMNYKTLFVFRLIRSSAGTIEYFPSLISEKFVYERQYHCIFINTLIKRL